MHQRANRKKGPTSSCEGHWESITQWYKSGLSIERIHHELKLEHGIDGSYQSVYRFVKTLEVDELKRVYRMEWHYLKVDLRVKGFKMVTSKRIRLPTVRQASFGITGDSPSILFCERQS